MNWNDECTAGSMVGKGLIDREVRQLLEQFAHPQNESAYRDRALLHVMLGTGLRAAEIVSLRFSRSFQDPAGNLVFRLVAKGKRERFTIIPERALEAVRSYHRACSVVSDAFFLSLPGHGRNERELISANALGKIVRAWGARTATGRLASPHAFRHTVAQKVFDSAGSVAAQKLCGHASPGTTSRFYTRAYIDPTKHLEDWFG